jgi:hypothetical protein
MQPLLSFLSAIVSLTELLADHIKDISFGQRTASRLIVLLSSGQLCLVSLEGLQSHSLSKILCDPAVCSGEPSLCDRSNVPQ